MFIWLLVNIWKSTFLRNRLKQIFLKDVIYNLKFAMGNKTKILWIWQNKRWFFFNSYLKLCGGQFQIQEILFFTSFWTTNWIGMYRILIGWFQGSRYLYVVNVSFPILPCYSHTLHTLINRLASFEKNKQDC